MAEPVSKIPRGYHTLTPYFTVIGAAEAIEYYKRAFGAEEIGRLPGPDGKIMHAELQIGDSRVMLGEESPQSETKSPRTLGAPSMALIVYTGDVDQLFDRAVKAGAKPKMQPEDMFWGDRYGTLEDPFGVRWSIATHLEDVSYEEMAARAQKLFSKS